MYYDNYKYMIHDPYILYISLFVFFFFFYFEEPDLLILSMVGRSCTYSTLT